MCQNETCLCSDVKMELTWLHGGGLMNDNRVKKNICLLQVVLTSSYFLEYIILLGNYQRCAVEVTVFLKIAVNEGSLCDHYIPIKIYAPGIQIIDLDNAGHNKESS